MKAEVVVISNSRSKKRSNKNPPPGQANATGESNKRDETKEEQSLILPTPLHRRARTWIVGVAAATVITAIGTTASFWVTRTNEALSEPSKPLSVNVNDDVNAISTFHDTRLTVLVPIRPTSPIPQPSSDMCSSSEFRNWSLAIGGSDYRTSRFRLVLQGLTDKALFISDVTAQAIRRKPAVKSVELICENDGGGAQMRDLAIDLDSSRPAARYRIGKKPFGFTLAKGETEVFDITAYTEREGSVDWNLKISGTVNGKHQTFLVQDRGRPFHTSAISPANKYQWRKGEWVDTKSGHTITTPYN